MPDPSFSPGPSAAELSLDRTEILGPVLGAIAYGIHVAVFAQCIYHITPARARLSHYRGNIRPWLLLGFIFVLFAMATMNVAYSTKLILLQFIDHRDYPGGPNAWVLANYPQFVAGNVSFVVANSRRRAPVWDSLWIIVFPFLVYLASTAMSILSVFQTSRPDASLWSTTGVVFSVPYFSISIGLNILLTLLLVTRLLYMSYNAKHSIGPEHSKAYVSIAAMLLESATPYAVTGMIFIITYARNSNVQHLVLPILGQVMCISPEIIILRVAMGRAVESRHRATGSSVRFDHRDPALATTFSCTSSDDASGKGNLNVSPFHSSMSSGSTMLGSQPHLLKENA
ncbi:hypothetical protein C2E23DRAFT_889776 [Lenzites betulinus]|nr:hypothetical protein C2E23DRAFT_889776 [Lenzites betulinus]